MRIWSSYTKFRSHSLPPLSEAVQMRVPKMLCMNLKLTQLLARNTALPAVNVQPSHVCDTPSHSSRGQPQISRATLRSAEQLPIFQGGHFITALVHFILVEKNKVYEEFTSAVPYDQVACVFTFLHVADPRCTGVSPCQWANSVNAECWVSYSPTVTTDSNSAGFIRLECSLHCIKLSEQVQNRRKHLSLQKAF